MIEEEFNKKVGTFEVDLQVKHHYAEEMNIPKGYSVGKHKHDYDHDSWLAKGVALVETDTESREYSAPVIVKIRAGTYHKITAIEDVQWFCVHPWDGSDFAGDLKISK